MLGASSCNKSRNNKMKFKYVPHIELEEDLVKNGYTFSAKGYSQFVPREELQKCWKELKITNTEMFYARFSEVCDWFIAQTQYVDFK